MSKKTNIDRREFLRRFGLGAAVTTAALAGCDPRRDTAGAGRASRGDVPEGSMTYRINPSSGEKVSVLGYGCMRWPTVPDPSGQGDPDS